MAKRRSRKRRDDNSRISQLPNNVLHHILSLLSQKEAIRTCVLSKSWRHLGYTPPNVVLRERDFSYKSKLLYKPVLDKTLQTYQDLKLPIQELHLEMSSLDSNSYSLLEKSVKDMNLKTFGLAFTELYPLPPFIFQAEHLITLHLKNCYIDPDEIFVNMNKSSCPLIEYLVLEGVCNFSFKNHFPHLKSLCLRSMRLSAKSFDNLSNDDYFPCIEELELDSCHVIKEEFVLSSRSIKRLIIRNMSCKGAIDAANILYFKVLTSCGRTPLLSLTTTTSRECKSQIDMLHWDYYGDDAVSTCLLLKALSQSRIYFKPFFPFSFMRKENQHLIMGEPAVVEHLDLSACTSILSYAEILICFFGFCRPRYMSGMCPGFTAETELRSSGECTSSSSCKSKIIIKDRLRRSEMCYFWQQDLEELSCEVWDDNSKKWYRRLLRKISCKTLCALSDKKHIRYRLIWRGEKTV